MTSICLLNTWGGCVFGYEEWLRRLSGKPFDIMCFEEVHNTEVHNGQHIPEYVETTARNNRPGPIWVRQMAALRRYFGASHHVYFAPSMRYALHEKDVDRPFPYEYGIAMCIRRTLQFVSYEAAAVNGAQWQTDVRTTLGQLCGAARMAQAVTVRDRCYKLLTICHFHGSWLEGDKTNHPARSVQCERVVGFLARHLDSHNPERKRIILCGDFNFITDTNAMHRLVKSNEVWGPRDGVHLTPYLDTRTKWYPDEKRYREADHVIISPSLVDDKEQLKVDATVLSDHALLSLELDL